MVVIFSLILTILLQRKTTLHSVIGCFPVSEFVRTAVNINQNSVYLFSFEIQTFPRVLCLARVPLTPPLKTKKTHTHELIP